MYDHGLHTRLNTVCTDQQLELSRKDNAFYARLVADIADIRSLYLDLYAAHPFCELMFDKLLQTLARAYANRSVALRLKDESKIKQGHWYLSNEITGMSLYVDRFCGDLHTLKEKLDYFTELGVNFLHLMPLFKSPAGESDGGYAVSDFREVDPRFGSLDDLENLQQAMQQKKMYLMLDIVLNHTSHQHEWAEKAKAGDPAFQDFYYMFSDRVIPDQFDPYMPDIFPDAAPGNFTWNKECRKWVMTVFHNYQWDLNYTNPAVFVAMLDTIFFYANLGVDILRIDAPAFIWKQVGTACQNLPQAHSLLRMIRQCVQVAAPGMALLGEAIVAPKEVMQYFGTGAYAGRECDFAYNATQMALQWDALATADTRVMLAAQYDLLQKPYGTGWITYTRCHDDIGLGFEDASIAAAGFSPFRHRKFLQEFYSGKFPGSFASGALFSVNPKTADARISGSLASLCGLEKALATGDEMAIDIAIRRITLMQAQSILLGGVPMIFYGDEVGYTNDYSYQDDPARSYDNRWMHRPLVRWEKNNLRKTTGTPEQRIFSETQQLIRLRKQLSVFADLKNIRWLTPHNIHVAGFLRQREEQRIYCLFNFSNKASYLTWYIFREHGAAPKELYDHWRGKKFQPGSDQEYLVLEPYGVYVLEPNQRAL